MTYRVKTNRGGYLEHLLRRERFGTRREALDRISLLRREGLDHPTAGHLRLELRGAPIYVVEDEDHGEE